MSREEKEVKIREFLIKGYRQEDIRLSLKVGDKLIKEVRDKYSLNNYRDNLKANKAFKEMDRPANKRLTPEDKMVLNLGFENCTHYIRENGPRAFRKKIVDKCKSRKGARHI